MPQENTSRIIELNEDLIQHNQILAQQNLATFTKFNIKSFDFVGAIGAGKTAILVSIINKLSKQLKILVINGDVTTRIDADRIEKYSAKSIQINTGRECALNSYHISQVLKSVDLRDYNVVLIENVGNLICPSDFILGTNKRIVVVSITEGPWVIRKHPMLFKLSDIAVINKVDLLDIMDINVDEMISDAKQINPNIKILPVSAETGENIPKLIDLMFKD